MTAWRMPKDKAGEYHISMLLMHGDQVVGTRIQRIHEHEDETKYGAMTKAGELHRDACHLSEDGASFPLVETGGRGV